MGIIDDPPDPRRRPPVAPVARAATVCRLTGAPQVCQRGNLEAAISTR